MRIATKMTMMMIMVVTTDNRDDDNNCASWVAKSRNFWTGTGAVCAERHKSP